MSDHKRGYRGEYTKNKCPVRVSHKRGRQMNYRQVECSGKARPKFIEKKRGKVGTGRGGKWARTER